MRYLAIVALATLGLRSTCSADCDQGKVLYEQALDASDAAQKVALLEASVAACKNFRALYELANAYLQQGREKDAETQLRAALDAAPNEQATRRALVRLGQIYLNTERKALALKFFRQAQELRYTEKVEEQIRTIGLEYAREGMSAREIGFLLSESRGFGVEASVDLWVHFDFNSAELDAAGRAQVEALGQALEGQPLRAGTYRIVGHTDRHGSEAYNLNLSRRRAESVRRYLQQRFSLAEDQFAIEGRGKRELMDPNPTARADSLNRRVEIVKIQ